MIRNGLIPPLRGGRFRYGTAGTTTTTTLSSSGGLLINIDSATGDIARTTDGWIEDEKYGWYYESITTTNSGEFDTAVTRTGAKTLKLSTTNATGTCFAHTGDNRAATYIGTKNKLFPIKASTKYRSSVWVKTNNIVSGSANFRVWTWDVNYANRTDTFVANTLAGTNDWTLLTREFTTNAAATYGMFEVTNQIAGNISDAWFDINSMTLEEVVEPVANSLTSSSPSLVSLQAVGSTDNIDQSLDTGGAAAFTYVPLTAISEVAIDRQTFVPTKGKITRIGVWVVNKGTGNWTLTVHDASNVVQATATITNASLTNGAFNYFTVICNVTALSSYHFHVTSTVLDGNLKSGVTLDCEGASYIENYYKPTTNFKTSQNNFEVDISSDEEGFIEGSVLGISKGTWSFTDPITAGQIQNNMYFSRSTGCTFSGNTVAFSGAGQNYILKVNLGLVGSGDMTYTLGFATNNTISYSYDNIAAYTSVGTLVGAGGSVTIPMNGYSTVYIKNNANAAGSITNHSGTCPVTTSGLSVLKNYPTNKDIIKQYSTTLGSATTSATYRATKWGFPAIEYSATEYKFLDVDTTATGSTVAFSELGTTYTTVADGASLAITSTSTPNIFVKANITANRIYVSSNDYNASSSKDGSLKQTFTYNVIQ